MNDPKTAEHVSLLALANKVRECDVVQCIQALVSRSKGEGANDLPDFGIVKYIEYLIPDAKDVTPLFELAKQTRGYDTVRCLRILAPRVTDVTPLIELAKQTRGYDTVRCIEILAPRMTDVTPLIELAEKAEERYIVRCIEILAPRMTDVTPLFELAKRTREDNIDRCIRILRPYSKNDTLVKDRIAFKTSGEFGQRDTCCVCYEVCWNKTECNHVLCRLCQVRCSQCPMCRQPFTYS